MEYHKLSQIQIDLNSLIDRMEDNQKVFANHLAILEKNHPHFYYQTEFYKRSRACDLECIRGRSRLRSAIASLKKVRDAIGSIDWA